jgi:MarR-like DNA-binding transcriptional regulator SgrR of sgrS sRNA
LPILLVAVAAHAETRPPYGGRAIASLPSAPASLDPVAAQSAAELALVGLVFDTLYRLDGDGHPVPHLAEGPPILTPNLLEARIAIRDGALFHDGRPLRPADVSASLRRAKATPATAWALASVVAIGSVENQVVLTLRRPTPELAALLATPQLAVTPVGRAPGKLAIGSGPFKVKRFAPEARRIELEAAADHFAGRPYLDALVLRWFEDPDDEARGYEAGEADLSLRGAVAFAGHEPKYPTTVNEGPATVLEYIGFGAAHKITADPGFRRGVSLAMNRAALRHVGAGERVAPTTSPVSPDLGGPATTDLAAHAAEAQAALARAKEAGALELIVDRSRPDDVDVAARVVAALDRAGVALSYSALAPAELARRVAAGQCDLYIGQLALPSPDPLGQLAVAFAAGGDGWAAGKLAEGPLGADAAAAAFAARVPIVPLFHRALRAHHKRTLRGVAFDVLGRLGWADVYVWTGPDTNGDSEP